MSKIIKFIMIMPLIGTLLIYLYAFSSMIFLESTDIFLTDSKGYPFSLLYKPLLFIVLISYFTSVLGLFVVTMNLISKKKIVSNKFIFLYLLGIMLKIFSLSGGIFWHIEFWFFD